MEMKMIECECGFMVRSGIDDELAKMTMMHVRDVHKKDMSRGDAMKMAKPARM
jgi:predicted small metal-binding protein